jgi:hypothetical protein
MALAGFLGLVMVVAGGPLPQIEASLPAAVGGWRRSGAPATYDRESIFSYIDGHGEVYRAYGMRQCLSQRYARPGHEDEAGLVLDVFEMETPAGAFGVFTHDLDGEAVALGHDGLMRSGWLSFWKGRVFVSLYAEEDSPEAREALVALGRSVDAAVGEQAALPPLVGLLPEGWLPGSRHFFFDGQILSYHLPAAVSPQALDLSSERPAALARYRRDGRRVWLLIAEYSDPPAATAALERARSKPLGSAELDEVRGRAIGRYLATVMQAASVPQAEALLDEAQRRIDERGRGR